MISNVSHSNAARLISWKAWCHPMINKLNRTHMYAQAHEYIDKKFVECLNLNDIDQLWKHIWLLAIEMRYNAKNWKKPELPSLQNLTNIPRTFLLRPFIALIWPSFYTRIKSDGYDKNISSESRTKCENKLSFILKTKTKSAFMLGSKSSVILLMLNAADNKERTIQ